MSVNISFLAPLFALTAAFSWGAGDFTGGLAARRSDPFRAVFITYSVGLVVLIFVVFARREPLPSFSDLAWGAVAGLSGMFGLVFLFRGFSSGRMGTVAPVSAVVGTSIPVIFTAFTKGLPQVVPLMGFGAALVGIWLLSRPERMGIRPTGLGLAILAGLGFGGFFTCIGQVGPNTVFWPLVAGRLAACSTMAGFALITQRPILLRQSPLKLFILAGVLDVIGNLFFLLATQHGRLDITAVLGSLYPAVTAMLAWILIKEHLSRMQVIGVSAALLAIVLITL